MQAHDQCYLADQSKGTRIILAYKIREMKHVVHASIPAPRQASYRWDVAMRLRAPQQGSRADFQSGGASLSLTLFECG
jgi:hypothetical protein